MDIATDIDGDLSLYLLRDLQPPVDNSFFWPVDPSAQGPYTGPPQIRDRFRYLSAKTVNYPDGKKWWFYERYSKFNRSPRWKCLGKAYRRIRIRTNPVYTGTGATIVRVPRHIKISIRRKMNLILPWNKNAPQFTTNLPFYFLAIFTPREVYRDMAAKQVEYYLKYTAKLFDNGAPPDPVTPTAILAPSPFGEPEEEPKEFEESPVTESAPF
jgi:hypothetical protein